MPNEEPIPLSPVSGYTIRTIPAYDTLVLQFNYLSHAMQALEEAHESPNFSLTRAQTIELRDALTRAIDKTTQSPIPAEMKN